VRGQRRKIHRRTSLAGRFGGSRSHAKETIFGFMGWASAPESEARMILLEFLIEGYKAEVLSD
jgi:hypothetical protein